MRLAEIRKFLVAAAAAVSAIVSSQTLTGSVEKYAVLASTVLGALLTYVVPNALPRGTVTRAQLAAEVDKLAKWVESKIVVTGPVTVNSGAQTTTVTDVPAAPVIPPLIPPDV
jgi:hypothetical protein